MKRDVAAAVVAIVLVASCAHSIPCDGRLDAYASLDDLELPANATAIRMTIAGDSGNYRRVAARVVDDDIVVVAQVCGNSVQACTQPISMYGTLSPDEWHAVDRKVVSELEKPCPRVVGGGHVEVERREGRGVSARLHCEGGPSANVIEAFEAVLRPQQPLRSSCTG